MKTNQNGFTLIELLVTVAIIGLLAAIALPQFSEYKKRAFDARALSDLKNGLTAQEAYYVDNQEFVHCFNKNCEEVLPGLTLSEGVNIELDYNNTSDNHDSASCHSKGSKYYYISLNLLSSNGELFGYESDKELFEEECPEITGI